jgi:hypothetical protein
VLCFHVTNIRFRGSIKKGENKGSSSILIKYSLNRTSYALEVMVSQRVCTIGGSEGEKASSEIFVRMVVHIL